MRSRLNFAFPSLVLIAVACIQIWRAKHLDQTPWKGGGFGMFATSDTPGARFLRVSLIASTGEYRVEVPNELVHQVTLARTVPTAGNARDLARRVASLTWVKDEFGLPADSDSGSDPTSLPGEAQDTSPSATGQHAFFRVLETNEPEPAKDKVLAFTRVRVEIWKYTFDPGKNVVTAAQIQWAEADRPAR